MADSNIGALPQAPQVDDNSLLVMEQQGTAMKLTGAQLKGYAKQGVELEFQEYLDEAKRAAESATGAVSAVTDMTVEAHPSETATVTKSTRAGKINLDFGLPRGEKGEPGPAGAAGPRGPQGAPGNGLTLLGHYGTEDALRTAVTSPKVGDAYGVGLEAPYDVYVFDGVTLDWKNYGPLSGGGGGGTILPENVVTTPGGAELAFANGDGPHTVTFDFEEEPPLTAEDVAYGSGTVDEAISQLFTSVSDGKALIASAVTDKGISTAPDASFSQMAENIRQITTGSSTEDATATPGDILAGKTAYTAAGKVEGLIPTLAAKTYIPGTAAQTIANGQYLGGTQIIQGDPNLTSGNIKKGVSIFGVAGAVEQNFLATLTVTADVGAVVTAIHTSGAEVEALSTTGTVVLELPIEGKWTVTARRGVAQYNSVVIEVSSRYSAALTAEMHIVYYNTASNLSRARHTLAAAANNDYALFAGGVTAGTNIAYTAWTAEVDSFDAVLTHETPEILYQARFSLSAAAYEEFALFAGGRGGTEYFGKVDRYGANLVHQEATELMTRRADLAGTSIGDYILFGGGRNADGDSAVVDAYYTGIVRSTPKSGLAVASSALAAAANANYGIFGILGGTTAYNSELVRTTATGLNATSRAAAKAGNYVLFIENDAIEAYDLFLTRTTAEQMEVSRTYLASITLEDHAIFAGGIGSVSGQASDAVDVYDHYLVHTTPQPLKAKWGNLSAVSIGQFALIGGGYRYENAYNQYFSANVYVYQYV